MKIFVGELFHEDAYAWLAEQNDVELVNDLDHVEELDAILIRTGSISGDIIRRGKKLKILGRHGVGFDSIDVETAKECGVSVVNVPFGNVISTAEYMVAMTMCCARRLYEANCRIRRGEIHSIAPASLKGFEITGKNLGLVGMGNIGSVYANMLKGAFRVKAYGYDPFVSSEIAEKRGFTKVETLEELVELSDIVAVVVPLNDGTRNMFSGSLFNHFKPQAILINDGRGGIVNEDDLYEALKAGKLAGAAFDVFANEPNYGSKLFELENFSATPHLGGNTDDCVRRNSMDLVRGAVHYLRGESLEKQQGLGIIC